MTFTVWDETGLELYHVLSLSELCTSWWLGHPGWPWEGGSFVTISVDEAGTRDLGLCGGFLGHQEPQTASLQATEDYYLNFGGWKCKLKV